ncbi:DUF4169 family protein [Citreimonas sp.]|uniref:DUF4169 family protein n=1 Tax=Citreimonas sp. TaxID=3036715 RepID=UPI0035C821A4
MTGVVNLNKARKARDRAEKRRQADANAAFHGLSKAQKARARAEAEKAGRTHAGKKRDTPDPDA